MDTESEVAFPTLASAVPASSAPSNSAWGSSTGPRIKSAIPKAPVFTDSFTLSAIDLSNSGKDGKPASLGEVIKQVIAKYKVKVEASANQKARQTTFHVKAESQKELDKAKRSLLALLSPVVCSTYSIFANEVFINYIRLLLSSMHRRQLLLQSSDPKVRFCVQSLLSHEPNGHPGATLKQIRDQTSVRVDIPRRDPAALNGNGHANGTITGKDDDDDDEEPTIPVTLVGPQPLAYEAQALLKQIISSKTSKSTQRVRDIPAHILPFILARKALFLAAAQGGTVTLALNSAAREITASGDREAVVSVVESIKQTIETFKTSLTSVKLALPKKQHRLLIGPDADAVMSKSNCAVVVGNAEESGNEVTVWGMSSDLPAGLGAAISQANSQHIQEVALPEPISLSKQLAIYLNRIHYDKIVKGRHPTIDTYLPSLDATSQSLSVDLVGPAEDVGVVVMEFSKLIGDLSGGTMEINVDWLLHRVIIGKNGKK